MKNPFINLGVIARTIFTTHSSILQAAQKDTTFVATQNPVVSYKYLGDPAALVHDGTVYIYAGHDECPAPQQYYLMNEWCIFSTKDMKTFTEHAYTLKATDFNWAKGEAWASQVIEHNGKFYWYVTVEHATIPGKSIGVAVSDSPIGPFKDARGSALITNDMTTQYTSIAWDDIDPTVFIDDDGQAYIFWGRRHVAKLGKDMITVDSVIQIITTPRKEYSEGPIFFKRKGIYYYLYTIGGDEKYQYAYVMSKTSPMGPFEYPEQDIISTTNYERGVFGPGHGCVFNPEGTDDYYFAYLEFGRRSTNRQTYVNRLEFNEDGTIRPVDLTLEGVGALRKIKQEKKLKTDTVYASSISAPLNIEPMKDPSCRRTEYFIPAFAIDGANGSRWMAADQDKENWIIADLGTAKKVHRSEVYFVRPTAGHAYLLEGSADGKVWQVCGGHEDIKIQSPHIDTPNKKYRYLRIKILKGIAGIWEWNIH